MDEWSGGTGREATTFHAVELPYFFFHLVSKEDNVFACLYAVKLMFKQQVLRSSSLDALSEGARDSLAL